MNPNEQHLGTALREARLAAGISLTGMARRTSFSKSYLGLVETRRKTASARVVIEYERVLGRDCVNRRGLITSAAATFVAPHAASELLKAGFTAAFGKHEQIGEWRERVERYGTNYMTLGAGELQNHIARDLIVVQQQLEHPQMWAVASRIMTMAGKTSGDSDDSVDWYRLAGVAADRSEDESTRIWVRGRAALALAYEGASLSIAERLAQHALGFSDRPSLGRLNALLGLAHVRGIQGRRKEALTTLNEARRVFDRVGSADQISDYAIPEWRMSVISSLLLSRLGEEPQAIIEQTTATKTMPNTLPRFATHIELHRGLMLTRSGDHEGGVAYAQRALDALPPEKHSQSLRLMMDEICRPNRYGGTN